MPHNLVRLQTSAKQGQTRNDRGERNSNGKFPIICNASPRVNEVGTQEKLSTKQQHYEMGSCLDGSINKAKSSH